MRDACVRLKAPRRSRPPVRLAPRSGSANGRLAHPQSLRAVGSFVPALTRKVFEKYGFSSMSLVTDWAAIAGRELAAYTLPERLKWPRQPSRGEDAPEGSRRPGATLVLRVEGARGLDVQFAARQIIERINAYFGFAAVAKLRLVQGPVAPAGEQSPQRRPLAAPTAHDEVAGIADVALREALSRLGAGVRQGAR